ncbi:MAG: hypothetical protein V7603_5031 [Micromonosporaceae bacterium]
MATTQVKPGLAAVTADDGRAGGDTDPSAEERSQQWHQDRMRYRLRHQARPHYSAALLVAAAGAARAAVHLTGDEAAVALATAGAAYVTAVVVATVARRRLSSQRLRRWATTCAFVAASWLTWAANAGLSFDTASLLAMLTAALALPYWQRHRIPNTAPAEPEHRPGLDGYPRLWASYCGGTSGGPLPGSWLTSHELIEAGERFVLQLMPGKQTLGGALAALPLLRTGLHLLPRQDLIMERHPILDESCLQLTIVTRSTVLTTDRVPWPGPNYDPATGTVALGPYIDGEGVGRWRMYCDNGLMGGFLCGATRTGKSRIFDSVALSAAATGFSVVWFGDPQQGASSPMLARHADYVARDIPAIRRMLALAILVKELRQAENALEDREGFVPSKDRPGLLIFIDECHRAFADPQIQYMATELAREGGKCGVAIVAASQVATLDTFGKGERAKDADALRSSLCAGNLVVLYTKSTNAKEVLKIDVDPTQFPRIPGYAYLVDQTGHGRSAPLRGYYVADEDRDAWADDIVWRGLDTGAANAAGDRYLHRRDHAATEKEALAAKVAAMRAGQPGAWSSPPPATATPNTSPPAAAPAAAGLLPTIPADNVIQFPTWPPRNLRPAAPAAAQRTTAVATAPILSTERGQRIYKLIRAGVVRTGKLQEQSGYGETHVRNTLHALVTAGLIRDAGHGKWTHTSAAADDEEVEQPA